MTQRLSREDAIEEATGCSWSEWQGMLYATGAQYLNHTERVELIAPTLTVPEDKRLYWARSISLLFNKTA